MAYNWPGKARGTISACDVPMEGFGCNCHATSCQTDPSSPDQYESAGICQEQMSALQRALVLLAVPRPRDNKMSPSPALTSPGPLVLWSQGTYGLYHRGPSRGGLTARLHRNLTRGTSPYLSREVISTNLGKNFLEPPGFNLEKSLGLRKGGWVSSFLGFPEIHPCSGYMCSQVVPWQQRVQAAHLCVVVGSRSNGLRGLFFSTVRNVLLLAILSGVTSQARSKSFVWRRRWA